MLPQVFDLDRHVVAEFGKLSMHRLDNRKRVRWPIEEIRIAERDVPCARSNLLLDICKNDFAFDHAKRAVVPPAQSGSAGKDACSRASPRSSQQFVARRPASPRAHISPAPASPPDQAQEFLARERNHGL